MRVRVQSMNSYEARVANTQLSEDELERQDRVECEGDILIDQARILHGNETERHRPYLLLSGKVQSITGEFLNGVTEMSFPTDRPKPRVDYRYDFSNQELADLCQKGLYDKGFRIPDIFINNHFELPMTCDICSVKNTDVPIMFVNIDKPYNMEINCESSGYILADYFDYARVVEDEFEDIDEFDLSIDDMFYKPKQVEAAPKVELEVTEEQRKLRRVLHKVEDYAVTKATQRHKELEQKKKSAPEVQAEDVERIREEIKQSSVEIALQKAKEDNDNGLDVKPVVLTKTGEAVYGEKDKESDVVYVEDFMDDKESDKDEPEWVSDDVGETAQQDDHKETSNIQSDQTNIVSLTKNKETETVSEFENDAFIEDDTDGFLDDSEEQDVDNVDNFVDNEENAKTKETAKRVAVRESQEIAAESELKERSVPSAFEELTRESDELDADYMSSDDTIEHF